MSRGTIRATKHARGRVGGRLITVRPGDEVDAHVAILLGLDVPLEATKRRRRKPDSWREDEPSGTDTQEQQQP